ncbi:thioredoxin domain-containing protein [Peptococcaceae bacterium 1198_IL3148]
MTNSRKANRLIKEKSPYLLQHAYNPVDWYPWGLEAFEKAKAEGKPIFLSIGYSTCHWCHVMERESFEDEEVAAVLNQHFIAIKVDREERPDIDQIYMTVCQGLTGHGGWPLTIVMTPDKKPFFAGTYFPKHSRYGMPGLLDVLNSIQIKWQQDPQGLGEMASQIITSLNQQGTPDSGEFTDDTCHKAYASFKADFDSVYGGFGSAPKFPTPHNLMFLLRYYKKYQQPKALAMVERTLEQMYRGGIYDHIGFGFSRYSTDNKWLVPHFEKMLYDNALLAMAYLEAYQITQKDLYRQVAKSIFEYVLRDMTSPEGGFYSAEDADSEGEEGKFYVWMPQEIVNILGEKEGADFCNAYDITKKGNFEGKSIPNLIEADLGNENLARLQRQCRPQLFAERERRVHPYKDDKILTAWNGLMIAALAKGAQVLQDQRYGEAAERAVKFIYQRLFNDQDRLLARHREGESAFPAYLDDYAFLTWGLLELYNATFKFEYVEKSLKLTDDMVNLFWDQQQGGFFFYGSDGEQLITRPKEIYDGAMPSGNSVAALNLVRIARITGEERWQQYADEQIIAFAGEVEKYPKGYSLFVMAGLLHQESPLEIVIIGDRQSDETQQMIKTVQTQFIPEATLVYKPQNAEIALPLLKGRDTVGGKTTAYICKDFACQAPITSSEELLKQINI